MKTKNQFQKSIAFTSIITILCLVHMSSFAGVTGRMKNVIHVNSECPTCKALTTINLLAPTTPEEASFEDEIQPDLLNLKPETPVEATFEEFEVTPVSIWLLAPVTPFEVTFEVSDTITLTPVPVR
jgi:hypothetical protein